MKIRLRVLLVTPILAAILLAYSTSSAAAAPFVPPRHALLQGVAGQPISAYEQATRMRPAVYEVFSAWGQWLPAIFADAQTARARLMLHITTASGQTEMITPGQIARGGGDAWLVALNQEIAATRVVTYVRWMAEMDAYWNPYSAFDASGRRRDLDHSTAAYRAAWRRATLILRGGSRAGIDAALHALGQPGLRAGSGDLPLAPVAMVWCPQVAGAPDIAGNAPRDYFPGRRYVDWVGTDFYSKFPNFTGLTAFYDAFGGRPFAFGEWAMWGADDPSFVDTFLHWVVAHPRVRMLVYNQGAPGGPFALALHPRSAARIRSWRNRLGPWAPANGSYS